MFKKLVVSLLSLILVFGVIESNGWVDFGLKSQVAEAAGSSAQYLGDDRVTQGNWIGVYGKDGYVLPYYKAQAASGRDSTVPGDVASLPSYVSGYTQQFSTYWVNANPSSDVRTLQSPDSNYARKSMSVYSGSFFTYTFNISDNNAHTFTVYTTDFGYTETVNEKFEILDLSDNVIDSRNVSVINNGVYISYKITGSFKIKATKVSGYNAYMEGFFFDKSVPVILRTSEAVKPGELLTVYGEDFETTSQIRFYGTTTYCPVTYVDPNGHYVTCTVPTTQPAGIFTLEASNSRGWSSTFQVNAPKLQWIYNINPWSGQTVNVVGRNLDAAEFGGITNTKVRLVDSLNTVYSTTVTSVNPFELEFTVPAIAVAAYYIEVSNNGGTSWYRYTGAQSFSLTSVGSDPLGLGVYWASEVNWTQYNAKTLYGATGNGTTDDTAALQAGLDNISAVYGGGVLYLPNGTYLISSALSLPEGVSIQGQSQSGVILLFNDTIGTGASIINTKGSATTNGKVGVARLTIHVANGSYFPDIALLLGENWGSTVNYSDTRTAQKIFVKETTVDYTIDRNPVAGHRGIVLNIVANKNVVIKNNTFKGTQAALCGSYVTQYMDVENNTFEYSICAIQATANYSVVKNNNVIGHINSYVTLELHGIDLRSQAYVERNTINSINRGGLGDGEAIFNEVAGGSTKMYGTVSSVSGSTVSVTGVTYVDWLVDNHRWDKWNILIVQGKGMGQLNEITAMNQTASTITVKDAWKIVPDSTSIFIVMIPMRDDVFYNNTAINCGRGFWFYGDNVGGVIANNTSTDSEGVFINTVYVPSQKRFNISYFNRLERNTVTGVSSSSGVAGVGIRYSPEKNTAPFIFGNLAYGTDIKGNAITGILPAPIKHVGIAPPVNGIYAYRSAGYSQSRTLSEAVNIQNNTLSTLDTGITRDNTSAGMIRVGNTFTNVTTPDNYFNRY